MEKAFDLIIRGGTVVDGTGAPAFEADVAVKEGAIAAVGRISGSGAEEIDARGLLVTPGFVDIHTHYDGQATWDQRMQPSSWHGVTSVVMGNCGVGFAPCRKTDHDLLIRLMEGVEDIPFPVLAQGLPWTWESFPEYLDALAVRRFDIDIGAQLPHAALRVFVMGERGANREPATQADINAMAAIAKRSMEAGALGFSSSRSLNHRASDGAFTPSLTAAEEELSGIALGMAAAGRGVLQFITDFKDPDEDFALLRRLAERSGRPLSFSLLQNPQAPALYIHLLELLAQARADGLEMRAQVPGRPVGVLLGLALTANPFTRHPAFEPLADLPHDQKLAALRDPAVRAALLTPQPPTRGPLMNALHRWTGMYLLGDEPDYEPTLDHTVAAMAAQRGVDPAELAYDHMLSDGGRGLFYIAHLNYAEGNLDPSYRMMTDAGTVPGLSDGGAHVGMICDASFPTTNVTHWTRDRTRGPQLPLEYIIQAQTQGTARAVGLNDRGVIAPGYRADLNVIDYPRLKVARPEIAYDLPGGGKRLLQRAQGYAATIVAGQITYRDGEPTGALPGRLVRGGQSAPVAMAAE